MTATVFVLNGPNLNLLGAREPHIYGTTTLAEVEAACRKLCAELDLVCEFRQTNHEGVLVDWIQEARQRDAAVVINPAGLSFHSVPVLDALSMIGQPVIEVHISNIHRRDAAHRDSMMSLAATGVICGLGPFGYELALRAVAQRMRAA
jgi:3-dehydroquinate dehydratase II